LFSRHEGKTHLEEDKMAASMKLTGRYVKIWEQCWDPKACVHIPFNGDKCIGFHACVRIVEDGGTLYLEAEVNGQTFRYALANACIPALSIGIATLEVCVTDLEVSGGSLKSLTLSVKGCVGGDIAGIHIGHCWDLYNQKIVFATISGAQAAALIEADATKAGDWGSTYYSHVTDASGSASKCECLHP
jgi:hypothetical protein